MINTWFKFEDKIQNTSKVFMLTRNHTDNKTKNNMSPLGRGGGGGGDINLYNQNFFLGSGIFINQMMVAYL